MVTLLKRHTGGWSTAKQLHCTHIRVQQKDTKKPSVEEGIHNLGRNLEIREPHKPSMTLVKIETLLGWKPGETLSIPQIYCLLAVIIDQVQFGFDMPVCRDSVNDKLLLISQNITLTCTSPLPISRTTTKSALTELLICFKNFIATEGFDTIVSFGGWVFSTDPSTFPIFRKGVTCAEYHYY
jgi:hypothetical protein